MPLVFCIIYYILAVSGTAFARITLYATKEDKTKRHNLIEIFDTL